MTPESASPLVDDRPPFRPAWLWRLRLPFLVAASVVILVWGVVWVLFGSMDHAFLVLQGKALSVEPAVQHFDELQPHDLVRVTFKLHNLTWQPVTVTGIQSTCGCEIPDRLPLTIAPRGSETLSFSVAPGRTTPSEEFEIRERLYLDVESRPIILRVRGKMAATLTHELKPIEME